MKKFHLYTYLFLSLVIQAPAFSVSLDGNDESSLSTATPSQASEFSIDLDSNATPATSIPTQLDEENAGEHTYIAIHFSPEADKTFLGGSYYVTDKTEEFCGFTYSVVTGKDGTQAYLDPENINGLPRGPFSITYSTNEEPVKYYPAHDVRVFGTEGPGAFASKIEGGSLRLDRYEDTREMTQFYKNCRNILNWVGL